MVLGLLGVLQSNSATIAVPINELFGTIGETRLAIGIVAEPNLTSSQFLRCIAEISDRLEGVIFVNGNQLVDAAGNVLAGPW
jgi:hypothetical protein